MRLLYKKINYDLTKSVKQLTEFLLYNKINYDLTKSVKQLTESEETVHLIMLLQGYESFYYH